ncbi:unnamed protein product [Tenebrio molitor]|nr:unnamed protein product [Tenebrio molitor]
MPTLAWSRMAGAIDKIGSFYFVGFDDRLLKVNNRRTYGVAVALNRVHYFHFTTC